LRTCALDPDTGASIMRKPRGATVAIRAAMRSGSQVEAQSTVSGAPVSAGNSAFVTTSSTWFVSNTASSTTSQRATSSSVAAVPPALPNAAVFAASMSKPFGEKPAPMSRAPSALPSRPSPAMPIWRAVVMRQSLAGSRATLAGW
jgi:hypothetical protein